MPEILPPSLLRAKPLLIMFLAATLSAVSFGTSFENVIQKVEEVPTKTSTGTKLLLAEFETPLFNAEGYLTFDFNHAKTGYGVIPYAPDVHARPPRGSRKLYVRFNPGIKGSPQTLDAFKSLLPLKVTVTIGIPVIHEAVIESVEPYPSFSEVVIIQLDSALPIGGLQGSVTITVNGKQHVLHLMDYHPTPVRNQSSDKFLLSLFYDFTIEDLRKLLPLSIQMRRRL